VITPFAFDQFFWGARVKALGLGPDPIPHKNLSVDSLAQAISIAVSDPTIRQRAHQVGQAVGAEDGIGSAVEIVQEYFSETSATERERSA
jgi:UDP:flavonoid glycosyltransferase YjiC (YdhE family)